MFKPSKVVRRGFQYCSQHHIRRCHSIWPCWISVSRERCSAPSISSVLARSSSFPRQGFGAWLTAASLHWRLSLTINFSGKSYPITLFIATNLLYLFLSSFLILSILLVYLLVLVCFPHQNLWSQRVWTLSVLFTMVIPMLRRGLGTH